ncbi:MAG: putative tRNA-dihydrouridine synthase [Candidatus Nitrosopelagicus brevis]|jgi:tRNA-dihydrouridine synthase B|nr:tRNA dihydrouridine synthase DusB [Candidatus Nitrosopelagicus sp.]MEC7707505.1 tRNA dihydrouridine synthase DusB [Thermoproteota archaeon]CAI8206779.1 MAG: putative tRNA-dihydrouridine synthase [Candidatus Nitrosopelagicus brevis]MEC9087219.1 tRNA dihydrouridine synthase DusB [Thermoproteota archaeon]MEC9436453.1 tRNA dihydrouridine synthase DusB [Thermoproteota archaeon]|tara:strand:+ start:207 stop:1172 length:966 start_codon:yes stop_codon:yes gene_type:complete
MAQLPNFTSKVFLAPMAGVSDPALRIMCKKMGAGLVVTELTSVNAIVAKHEQLESQSKNITEFIEFSEKERPLSVQLFGSDITALEKAAKIVEPHFDMIDYNMGCPAPHITKQMAGGALLQNADLTRQIFRTLVNSVKKPISLKMRIGVTEENNSLFLDIAKIAEQEGIGMMTLHPRTVSQGYSGHADWDMIKKLKQNASVPVVGNGDITSPEIAKKVLDYTGCDYLMIGRGAMGNPFIFEQINDYLESGVYKKYTLTDRLEAFVTYLELTEKYHIRFANIKQQAIRFTKGTVGGGQLRNRLSAATNTDDLKELLLQKVTV